MSGFDEPYWNALQLLGWVYLRAPDVVSLCSDDAGEVRWHFQEAEILGEEGNIERASFEATPPKPSTLTIELYATTSDGTARPFAKMQKAEEDIRRKLQEGAITPTGRPARTGARQNILGLDWIDLRIDFDLGSAVDKNNARSAYSALKFERASIFRVWPKIRPVKTKPTPAEIDQWMHNNVHRFVKRDLTIKNCQIEMGATARDAAASFNRLPGDMRLRPGKKPLRTDEIKH